MPLDLANINNYFNQVKNQFQKPIYQKLFRTNPFHSLVKRVGYEMRDGLQPEVITTSGELPTGYPRALPTVTISTGTGNSCDIDPKLIKHGSTTRSYKLEVEAWQTSVFCLNDLQWDWQIAEMFSNMRGMLTEYARVFWSDWMRLKNIQMINEKISTLTGGASATSIDSNDNFAGIAPADLPTAELDWKLLDQLYDRLCRVGGSQYAVGMSGGMPVFSLNIGPGYKRALFQRDTLVRDTVNWSNKTLENFTARGISVSINGFVPNVDEFPIRYKADGVTEIYPTRNVAATKGMKWELNPDYRTIANGGLAKYECVTVMAGDIYEIRPRPQGTVNFGDAKFDPVSNYVGDFWWINNKDMAGNTKGDKGFYRMEFQAAAKPVFPENGFAILTLAKDA
jgi:hypothetical protein